MMKLVSFSCLWRILVAPALCFVACAFCPRVQAQGTAFTYQGRLNDSGGPANGLYDFTFTLLPGTLTITNNSATVSNGLFTVSLDFGSTFQGGSRFLQIAVRTNGGGSFTTLSPAQQVTPSPYAIFAGAASNVTGVVSNSHLASSSLTINAGAGLTGGGLVSLGGSATLNNSGVLSVTGNSDITASTLAGAVTLGSSASINDVGNTLAKRDGTGTLSANNLILDGNITLQPSTASAGVIYSGPDRILHTYGYQLFAGINAGNFSTTGGFNVGVGSYALASNTTGNGNVGVGNNALTSNTSGAHDTAVGLDALAANTAGQQNTSIGAYALQNLTAASDNTAVGYYALSFLTNTSGNTAVGSLAMQNARYGAANTAVGYGAMSTDIGGSSDTAVGYQALASSALGSSDTAVGYQALYQTSAGNNTALGYGASSSVTSGSGNIAIGVNAGTAISTGNNNIDIGNAGFGNESDTIRIGTSQTKAVMLGIYGMTIATGGTPVYVNPSGLLGTSTSSARYKQNIEPMRDESDVLLSLRPVTFQYKSELDPAGTPQFGLVAEDVAKIAPALVVRDDKGQIYSVRYEAVNAMLLNEFLKEHDKVTEQEAELKSLKTRVEKLDSLEQKVHVLEKMVSRMQTR